MDQASLQEKFKQSLCDHVAEKGEDIQLRYGPVIGWEELQRILADRTVVRYPCEVRFTAEGLEAGELAHASDLGETPEEGFVIRVNPRFLSRLEVVPHLVFYQLVVVNYGSFASPDDAETFGAAALGLDREDYYRILCELADQLQEGGCGCH
jgi:hypothetical protein